MNRNNANRPRAVIVVSSHVARGAVGNRAIVFALETFGHKVWAVPTVILPWHPGHAPGTRIVPDAQQFAALLGDLAGAPWLGEVGAVLSGYLGAPAQAEAVATLVRRVRQANPDTIYLCDPVMGDAGGLYVPGETASVLRDVLMPLADIATPNRHELAWMAGARLDTLEAAIAAARAAPPQSMLVTSAPEMPSGETGNLLVSGKEAFLARHRRAERPPNGPGDLAAALFLARRMGGAAPAAALEATTASVCEILFCAAERGSDELMLETDAASLTRPETSIAVQRVANP